MHRIFTFAMPRGMRPESRPERNLSVRPVPLARAVHFLPMRMTTLPMPPRCPEAALAAPAESLTKLSGTPGCEDQRFLLRAFHSFAEAAASLEQSYGTLRAEVERLRRELAESNSDLARSSEENRRIRMHLDRILEGLPCGVLVAGADGLISMANPEALRLLGQHAGSAPLSSIAQLPARVSDLLEQCRRLGTEQELEARGPAESSRWLSARHASIPEESDRASIFILRDISERKRLEQAEDRARRDQALAEMSAILAHEIRNPLGSLELFAGLLAESTLEAEAGLWVEHIQAGLRTLAATVNNVLQFHSMPSPQRAPVDLGALLDWAGQFLAPLARQSKITLSVQNGARGVLLADRHCLEQVLLNLVLNAVRAMPNGGWIEIAGRTIPQNSAVELVVSDTGPGITPADLPEIFKPGFSRRPGSPGLGLSVCRKIVEQHLGTIRAANRVQGGAAITVIFPLSTCSLKGIPA